jgi:hypothetical protein
VEWIKGAGVNRRGYGTELCLGCCRRVGRGPRRCTRRRRHWRRTRRRGGRRVPRPHPRLVPSAAAAGALSHGGLWGARRQQPRGRSAASRSVALGGGASRREEESRFFSGDGRGMRVGSLVGEEGESEAERRGVNDPSSIFSGVYRDLGRV